MWWLILPAVIFGILIYLLAAPLFIEIDSVKGLCRFRFHQLAYGGLILHDDSVFFTLKIAWWKKEYDLLHPPDKKVKKIEAHKNGEKKRKSFRMKRMPVRILAVLKSFKLKKCYVNIDTGNMPANGILYPLFYLISANTGKTVMINFLGENEIILTIKNSMARMMWSFFRTT